MSPGATVSVADDSAPTYVYIMGPLNIHRASILGDAESLLVGMPNANWVALDGQVSATFVAPNATVDIKQDQSGNFYVKSLELHQDLRITGHYRGLPPSRCS